MQSVTTELRKKYLQRSGRKPEDQTKPLAELAEEIGVSAATLSRFERGESIAADTIDKIRVWLAQPNVKR